MKTAQVWRTRTRCGEGPLLLGLLSPSAVTDAVKLWSPGAVAFTGTEKSTEAPGAKLDTSQVMV